MATKKVKLPNDFERMIPEYHKGSTIYGEHIVRYTSAQEAVKGKIVLDIACGSGYGTKLLAEKAKKIYGVDVSEKSVEYAKQNYSAPNAEYIVGDGERIPLEDNSVEVVVSFETIEHIKNYKKFLNEVSRVLKEDGLLVISTPNDLEFAEGNHFHLHEFEYDELKSLLKEHFKNIESTFQGTWVYNAILPLENMTKEVEINIQTLNVAPIPKEKSIYFHMLCSNRLITEKTQPLAALSEHWSARDNQKKAELTDQHIKNLKEITKGVDKQLQEKQAEIDYLKNELNEIHGSKSWKMAQKLARAKARATLKN